MEPDPKLLSLLEKVNNPIETLTINLTIKGIYGFTDDWRITDESNPGIFANVVRYQREDMFGKIIIIIIIINPILEDENNVNEIKQFWCFEDLKIQISFYMVFLFQIHEVVTAI